MVDTWPPTLDELALDMSDRTTTAEQIKAESGDVLQLDLDAAVEFVEGVRPGFNYANDALSDCPAPTRTIRLGTLRLARRWYDRRRSPDGLVYQGNDGGSSRIPSVDPDIERMLGIGRYHGPVFA